MLKKTETMRGCRDGEAVVNNTINGQRIEQVKSFKYLGSIISEGGRSHIAVKTRIARKREKSFNKWIE